MSPLRWGIVGCGIAGRARARALRQREDVELVAVHRGRFAEGLGAPVVSEEEVLERAEIVSVSSPSETHAGWVSRALHAGCHVVVDYPLAASRSAAASLFAQARDQGRVLHVEHIELLTPTTRFLVKQVGGRPARMELRFASASPALPTGQAHALTQLSRLHRAIAVAGPIARIDTTQLDGAQVSAVVHHAAGSVTHLHALRAQPGRTLAWTAHFDGHVATVEGRSAALDGQAVELASLPLFATDTDVAVARVRDGVASYVDDGRILHALGAAEALGRPGMTPVVA